MNADDRAKLRRILASFDEAGLVALANKGLVRRAEKDLEAGGLSHEEADAAVLVRGPGWVVTMPPDGPARATDTTRATGVTRQILAATIYLRDRWAAEPAGPEAKPAAESAPDAAAEVEALETALLGLTFEDLQKWAGKTTVKEALPLVAAAPEVEVERHAGLTIRLVRHEVEARLLPGRGAAAGRLLDRVLTTAPKAQHRRWVVAAVLAFRQHRGQPLRPPEETALAEEAGAPVSRQDVLASARDLFGGMVATGLAHPSERMVQRLLTLSVSATAVHLPRLARLLRALADDVSLILGRTAAADTGRLFDRLCLADALARALAAAGPAPPRDLVGSHRTEYDPTGDLDLAGVGAYPWRTPSGYEGLTVLFWDLAGKRFLTWTTSRPVGGPGRFSLEGSYRGEAVWAGGGPPERLSRTRFTLRQARLNPLGRLSGSQQTAAAGGVPTEPARLDFPSRLFTRWTALAEHARTTYPAGLCEKNPLDRVVVLEPAAWGERWFDELQQSFCWRLADGEGRALLLTLPWAAVNEDAVEFLEACQPERDRLVRVVARVAFGHRGLTVEPLSLLSAGTPREDCVLNPAFDRARIASRQSGLLERLRRKFGRDRVATTMTADEDWDEAADVPGLAEGLPPGLGGRLAEAEGLLLRAAESGLRRLSDAARDRVRQASSGLVRAGLEELGGALAVLGGDGAGPGHLLWAGYLTRLHRQAVELTLGSRV